MDAPVPREDPATVPGPPAPKTVVPTARLTVVETVYYQSDGDPPLQNDSRYYAHLPGDEQVYSRRIKVDPVWSPLDLGWAADCYSLLLSNAEGGRRWTVPTADERADLDSRVVEVAAEYDEAGDARRTMHDPPAKKFAVPFMVVRPGESCRLSPAPGARYAVRCRAGTARCVVVAFPGGRS